MEEQEIDYRSLNTEELRQELKKLEKRILRITGDPLTTSRYGRKFFVWASNKNAVERVGEMMSTRGFILHLLFERHCTPVEVARIEKINEQLLELTNSTYKRTADLARLAASIKCEEDEEFSIEGKLVPEFDLPSSVLRLEDDSWYGSDFVRMAAILQETEEYQPPMASAHCYLKLLMNPSPIMTDKELGCENEMDDGTTWGEAWLRIPPLEHIIICYALHALVTHMNWSIPDVLRINNFKVEVALTSERHADQARNRWGWWSSYSLPRFKAVLLKEARESGAKEENLLPAVIQRCQDYFEDWADEALSAAGTKATVDQYLDAVYNTIHRNCK